MNRTMSLPIINRALAQKPVNGSLLLLSLDAWDVPLLPGWSEIRRDGGSLIDETTDTQVTYRNNNDPNQKIQISTYARGSREEAGLALAQVLEYDQLAELVPGPTGLGDVSFAHPPGVPPAVFFFRANIAAVVASFSSGDVDVTVPARVLDDVIGGWPQKAKPGALDVTAAPSPTPRTYVLRVTPGAPPPGEFQQFWSGAGALTYHEDVITVTFAKGETMQTTVYVYQIASDPNATPLVASVAIPGIRGTASGG